MSRRAVFLDRDGVINRAVVRDGKPYPPDSLDAFELLPGVPEALARFRSAGMRVVVVTNQPDVRTGVQRREVVDAMHERLRTTLPIDDIRTCFHVDADACSCRKPKPGMLFDAAREGDLELSESFLVGDRWRDVGAGRAAGCRTIWINRGYREREAESPDWIALGLPEAGEIILKVLASERTSVGGAGKEGEDR